MGIHRKITEICIILLYSRSAFGRNKYETVFYDVNINSVKLTGLQVVMYKLSKLNLKSSKSYFA